MAVSEMNPRGSEKLAERLAAKGAGNDSGGIEVIHRHS